jgi:hypothetical protein
MKNDPSHYKYDAATDTFTTKVQDYATYVTPLLAHGATCTGYALSVSPNALDKAADSLKTQIDSLNTDGEMATLRLNDLLNKTQTATQMTSNLISTFGKMMDGIVQNLRG